MPRYVIAYDISSPRTRRKVVNILERHGDRLQRSVYIVDVSKASIDILERKILDLLEENDSMLFIPCCIKCFRDARIHSSLAPLAVVA